MVSELFQKLDLLILLIISVSFDPYKSENSVKEGEKIQKFGYIENKKSLLDEKKALFIIFEMLSFGKI